MLPTWVGVVSAVSLAVIALAAIAVAAASVSMAVGTRTLVRSLEQLAGPAISDVRQIIASIKTEADALTGASREIRLKIVRAADVAESRLADLDALVETVQGEMEGSVLDIAATLRQVRRGLSVWRWGSKMFKGKRKRK